MDLPSLHKLFQMALETGWIAKVRGIFYIVPYCHRCSCTINERYYQICDLLRDEKGDFITMKKNMNT